MTEIKTDMAGVVFRIPRQVGEHVEAGEDVVVLESMKMEVPVSTPQAGEIAEIRVAEGDFVQAGQVVVVLR